MSKTKIGSQQFKPAFDSVPSTILLRRIAEVNDELRSRGALKLLAELEELRSALKAGMLADSVGLLVDESSGWTATLKVRMTDEWNKFVLNAVLTPTQRERYLTAIDTKAIAAGVKNGDLSREHLEQHGAVTKIPLSAALYVGPAKSEDPDDAP